jgi:type IV pilus assembly protein PilA
MRIVTKKNKGFTLIELMIAVAIVGILSAIALPAYINYLIRAQISESFELIGGIQVAIEEYYAIHGKFPPTMGDLPIAEPQGKYTNYSEQNGLIIVTFNANANTKIQGALLGWEAMADSNTGVVSWSCGNFTKTALKYLPVVCQSAIDLNGQGQ